MFLGGVPRPGTEPWPHLTGASELMDDANVSPEELRQALVFLSRINRWLLSRRWVASRVRRGRVLDVATGGGDIPEYLISRGAASSAVGIDSNPVALSLARELSPHVVLVRADALALPFPAHAFDTAVAHLVFHHLDETECVALLREMARVARRVVVADLERARVLYGVVWLLTRMGRSRLARHDGPISVRRAWTSSEIRRIAAVALPEARVVRLGPYRWGLVSGS